MQLPLLITGIAGVAGYNAFYYFRARYPGKVVGIRPRQTWRLTGTGIVAQDVEDPVWMTELFRRHQFRSVLNCVGNCALKSCELDPGMAHRVNVESAAVIADCVTRWRSRLVHLSSDLVFSGSEAHAKEMLLPDRQLGYRETDPTDPVTIYGKTMVEAEKLLLSEVPDAAILRISLPMGPSFNKHAGAIDWIGSRFRNQRPATLYFDEVRSCTYCDDLNPVFEWFLDNPANGIFHAGGPRASTLYEIAQIVNRVGGYDPALLKGCPRKDAGPMPPRAGNVSMASDKLIAVLGTNPFRPWPLGDDLLPTHRHWHAQRPRDEAGSFQRIVERLYHYPSDLPSEMRA